MMKPILAAGLLLGLACAVPAQALEHRESIDHRAGPIAADYSGSTRMAYRQLGAPGVGGRPGSLTCRWSVALSVERRAILAPSHNAARTLVQEDALVGVQPGWCHTGRDRVARLVEARRDKLRAALMALVAQDRAAILAEATLALGKGAG